MEVPPAEQDCSAGRDLCARKPTDSTDILLWLALNVRLTAKILSGRKALLKVTSAAIPSSVHKHKFIGTHQHLSQLFQRRQQIDSVSRKVSFGIPFRGR